MGLGEFLYVDVSVWGGGSHPDVASAVFVQEGRHDVFPAGRHKVFAFLSGCDLRHGVVVVATVGVPHQLVVDESLLQRGLLLEFDLRQFAFRGGAVVY